MLYTARANSGLTFRPDSSCVLWLPGQDDQQSATIRDRSGNGNNGTITEAAWARTGQGLWYLDFDGTDDLVDLGSSAVLLPDAFTVEVWALSDVSWATVTNYVIGWHTTQGQPALGSSSGKPFLYLGANNLRYFTAVAAGTDWRHWAYICPGATQTDINNSQCFQNGVELTVDSTDATGTQRAKDNLYVGKRATLNNWAGNITLVKMFNAVRTASQIANDYQMERHLFGV